jgi:acetyl-CoA acyltransferase
VREAYIIDAVRTPLARGKAGGGLAGVHPTRLLAHVLDALVQRTVVDPALLDDVIAGCVAQAGEQGKNIARNAVLAAGFPVHVPGTTIDRQCGSSQQAVHFAAQGIRAGVYDLVIAGGVESMSRMPMRTALMGQDPYGADVAARFGGGLVPQGISAELVAQRWRLSRTALDELAVASHERAATAAAKGWFAGETAPVPVAAGMADRDESIRPGTTAEALAALPPAFAGDGWLDRFPGLDWKVTAGNSSTINDGAAAILLASEECAARLGLRPRARIRDMAIAADDPVLMLTAVIPATAAVLRRAGLRLEDIDRFEVNEAFASVVLAWQQETGVPLERVNTCGGAIALGHPLGASGARLMTTLLGELERSGLRLGLQTMCAAGGQANATVIELVER